MVIETCAKHRRGPLEKRGLVYVTAMSPFELQYDKPPGNPPPFLPEGERAQIKIASRGKTVCARVAHLLW